LWSGICKAQAAGVDGDAGGTAHEVEEEVDAVAGRGGLDPRHKFRKGALEDLDRVARREFGCGGVGARGEAGAQGVDEVGGDAGGLGAEGDELGDAARAIEGADAAGVGPPGAPSSGC
jgi:hypothetical protein